MQVDNKPYVINDYLVVHCNFVNLLPVLQIMMQEQDTQLDGISGTLHNLKDIAGTMHQEVEDHAM
jgi:hypothetical protein